MPYPASFIADSFVRRGIDDGRPLTQMKLQKVVYFAHGLNLAKHSSPLINEHFQAWKFGPVVPQIYHHFKLFGSEPIEDITLLDLLFKMEDYNFDDNTNEIINITWDTLKDTDALKLSAWTHTQDSPWSKYYKPGVAGIVIPDDAIKEYFTSKFIV